MSEDDAPIADAPVHDAMDQHRVAQQVPPQPQPHQHHQPENHQQLKQELEQKPQQPQPQQQQQPAAEPQSSELQLPPCDSARTVVIPNGGHSRRLGFPDSLLSSSPDWRLGLTAPAAAFTRQQAATAAPAASASAEPAVEPLLVSLAQSLPSSAHEPPSPSQLTSNLLYDSNADEDPELVNIFRIEDLSIFRSASPNQQPPMQNLTLTPSSPSFHTGQSEPVLVDNDAFSPAFFKPILVADPVARRSGCSALCEALSRFPKLLVYHLPSIIRLVCDGCPYQDVSAAFAALLQEKDIHIPRLLGPSTFFKPRFSMSNSTGSLRSLCESLFLESGRVPNLFQVMAIHESYLERWLRTMDILLHAPAPLPPSWRNYILIMAAARHRCHYLVALRECEFLASQGSREWLRGVRHAPAKLRALVPLLALLAHKPWLVSRTDIAPLVRGSGSWSIGELVSAIVLACNYIALSGFVYGLGIAPELDLVDSELWAVDGPCDLDEREPATPDMSAETEKVAAEMKRLDGVQLEESDNLDRDFFDAGCIPEYNPPSPTTPVFGTPTLFSLDRYRDECEMEHIDFEIHDNPIFRVQGYELVHRFFAEAAPLLDDLFTHSRNMTYLTFGEQTGVKTTRFRRAVWQYVQRIHGICHDDYDYREVNIFLNRPLKNYVKKIACSPHTICRSDFVNVGLNLRDDEKCHLCLLALESRKQACLLYGLHAVMRYMTE